MIKLENINKSFDRPGEGELKVLRDIDFTVEQGIARVDLGSERFLSGARQNSTCEVFSDRVRNGYH